MDSEIKQDDVEKICRKYAFVQMQKEPYDANLKNLKDKIEKSYQESSSGYQELQEKISTTIKELENITENPKQGFFKGLRDYGFKGGDSLEDIKVFGDKLKEHRTKIENLETIIMDCYNKQAKFVHVINDYMARADKTIRSYQSSMKDLEKNIRDLHSLHGDKEKINEYVLGLIQEKEKESGDLSDEERNRVVDHLIEKGREELKNFSGDYLKLKNDAEIAKSLLQYKALADKYNELSESLIFAKEKSSEEVQKVAEVGLIYEVITSSQLDFLQRLEIPSDFIHAINDFVSKIEQVDSEFAEKCMENMFSQNASIKSPEFSEVTHGLIKHIREHETRK